MELIYRKMEAPNRKRFTTLALLIGSGFLVLGLLFVYTPVRAFEQSFDTMAMKPYRDGHHDSFRVYGNLSLGMLQSGSIVFLSLHTTAILDEYPNITLAYPEFDPNEFNATAEVWLYEDDARIEELAEITVMMDSEASYYLKDYEVKETGPYALQIASSGNQPLRVRARARVLTPYGRMAPYCMGIGFVITSMPLLYRLYAQKIRPFEWGVALMMLGMAIQILIPFLEYIASFGPYVGFIGGPIPLGYKVTMAFTPMTLFSLPIAAEVEAYLWLRRGRRSWKARLAFIAYSIGLVTAIAWKINEIYSFMIYF